MIVSMMVQDLRVVFSSISRNEEHIQKPASLTCESAVAPPQMARQMAARMRTEAPATAGMAAIMPEAMVMDTMELPTEARTSAATGKYAPATVNSMLTATNGYLRFYGWCELAVKLLRVQKSLFADESKEMTRAEYARLVQAAQRKDNERLALVIQTICATGIRVSELHFITVEAVQTGRAEISNKGKRRLVFLPEKLRRLLRSYARKQKRPPERYSPPGRASLWTEATSDVT